MALGKRGPSHSSRWPHTKKYVGSVWVIKQKERGHKVEEVERWGDLGGVTGRSGGKYQNASS